MNYKEKLKDARWLIRKKEILIRDKYTCKLCGSHGKDGAELHVHHLDYIRDREPWEYNDLHLVTLCDKCHNAVHKNNVRLLLRKSAISNDFICEEDTDWHERKRYGNNMLYIRGGTILASNEIGKIFVAADFPYFHYTDYNGEYRMPFTELPRNIEVEALFTLDLESGCLSTNDYIFPLDGIFGIRPRYANASERNKIKEAICSMIAFDNNE